MTPPAYIATLTGGYARVTGDVLDELRAHLQGSALTPSDEGYADGRPYFNAMHRIRPALTVRCSSAADVAHAVDFARKAGTGSPAGRGSFATSVLAGGHSVDGLAAAEGGMLIDLSRMDDVQVDAEQRLARVGGGARWREVDRATQAVGLVAPGGMVSETGVGGLTLEGGHGWLRRKHGLACDNLVEAEVVCADGERRIASSDSNADLFWALRGGGGNFGVVTSFTFRLHPLGPDVAFARTIYPLEDAGAILRAWRACVADAPDEVTSMFVATDMSDRPGAMVAGVYAGDPEAGMSALEPLRALGTPLADLSQQMSFTEVQASFDELFPAGGLQAHWQSQRLNELDDEAIDTIASRAIGRPTPETLVSVMHMGGAIASVSAEDTALPERSAPFAVSIDGMWTDAAENAERIAWVRSAAAEIGRYASPADRAPTLRRLAQVKAAYDPDNFFRLNRNIAPVP